MPICKSPAATMNKKPNIDISADHVTEAAKVKRTREHAYFNSYDFDAIEVLPYDDAEEEEEEEEEAAKLHKHLPISKSSISSKSNSTTQTHSSDASSHGSSCERYSDKLVANNSVVGGRKYLQRFGAFFGQRSAAAAAATTTSTAAAATATMPEQQLNNAAAILNNKYQNKERMECNGNFLLPRAMLKYQSTGSIQMNSMSTADFTAAIGKQIQSNNCNSNNNSNNNSNSKTATTTMTPTTTTTKMIMMSNVSGTNSNYNNKTNNKTRLGYNPNVHDSQTGFLIKSATAAIATTAALEPVTLATALETAEPIAAIIMPRQKKPSTSSSIATSIISATTTTNDSAISIERTNKASDDDDHATQAAVAVETTTATTTTKLTTTSKAAATKATVNAAAAAATASATESVQHGRAGSHQSHYSTDKSGSSGYYSSNVCSTYSLDEHIYCEPVIEDILDVNESKSKSIGKVRPQLQLPQREIATTTTAAVKLKPTSKAAATAAAAAAGALVANANKLELAASQRVDMHGIGRRMRSKTTTTTTATKTKTTTGQEDTDDEDDDDEAAAATTATGNNTSMPHYSENLRILESSIENLDRHLKNFPQLYGSQERIVSYVQPMPQMDIGEKLRAYTQLPTIVEGHDYAAGGGVHNNSRQQQHRKRSWQTDIIVDDSLLDIDLDSFLLVNEQTTNTKLAEHKLRQQQKQDRNKLAGIDNPSFLTDEQVEENNYKCAKYINSCPEDAYCVESDCGGGVLAHTDEHYVKRYEDQLHFQNTRELLEDVRDKIRLLTHSRNELREDEALQNVRRNTTAAAATVGTATDDEVPKELEGMIQTLKQELELYLQRMNQHSELEIRQLCSGLVKNQNVVKIQKAFERRRSTSMSTLNLTGVGIEDFNPYEAIHDGVLLSANGVPLSGIHQKFITTATATTTTSIRCASDPNFKMKRKSITEVFPITDYYIETRESNMHRTPTPMTSLSPSPLPSASATPSTTPTPASTPTPDTPLAVTQLQRNLSFHRPVLTQMDEQHYAAHMKMARKGESIIGSSSNFGNDIGSGGGGGGSGEQDSITEWHRKKPSIWEMYYGTNRLHQALLGKQQRMGELAINSSTQATLSYPSSRPESDFTLDLPRAEQLRLKMEKEKKFRQRCRYITTFLSLVFFLLTVMVVSLVLTRGKRMFGSMI